MPKTAKSFLYKRRYVPIEGHAPWLVSGNASELERIHYEGMDDVILLDFLPKELGFDMNMHILSFAPVPATVISKHTFRNTVPIFFPVRGVYNLDNNWIPVKKRRLHLYGRLFFTGWLWCRAW